MNHKEYLVHSLMVLGLSERTTPGEVESAYKKLAALYHPDTYQGDNNEEAKTKFIEVKKAYDYMFCYFNGEDYSSFHKRYNEFSPTIDKVTANRYYKKGIALYKQGDFNNALEFFTRAQKENPNNFDYDRGVIRCLITKSRRIHEAKDLCMELIKKDPLNGENHYLMGRVYDAAGLQGASKSYYRKAKELNYENRNLNSLIENDQNSKTGFFSKLFGKD